MRVSEHQTGFSCIAHNYLNFDFYFMLKGYRVSCWGDDINISGMNLSSVNFSNIGNQMKIIDTMEYFQCSLAQIASTAANEEKPKIKKLLLQFSVRHEYFRIVWQTLTEEIKEKILNILFEGKSMIPYEKIVDMNSLDLTPEKDFFEESEFYSYLKDKCITRPDYEIAKYFYQNLKMRNLKDMNDLYNVQDVIFLLEIVETRFQIMYLKNHYNPRKCNSASTLSGCIQRDLSKVMIVLSTSSADIEIFEKTLTGGFSCVNTKLGFDTEILLPNLTQRDSKMNIDKSYKSFKKDRFENLLQIEVRRRKRLF